jgi:hypothetical protein
MGRRRKHRKSFDCGHRGFGSYCQQCQQNQQEQYSQPIMSKQSLQTQMHTQLEPQRKSWKESFDQDPINLAGLPPAVVKKSRKILGALAAGTPYHQLSGSKMRFDPTLIRIPVGYHYRMLCRQESNQVVPLSVLTHEQYNSIASNTKR